MKKIIKSLFLLIIVSICFIIPKGYAASATISASKTSATVGDKITITVTAKAGAWNLSVSGSGISDSIVGYDLDGNKTTTKTYSITPSKAGTYTVTLKGDITDYDTEVNSNVSKSVTITVKEKVVTPTPTPTPKPKTETKKETKTETKKEEPKEEVVEPIKISKFEIVGYSIDFNNDKTEYTISVDKDVTKLYLIVEGNSITTQGDKTVDIKDKDEITVKVTKKTLSKEYKIKIERKKDIEEIKKDIEEELAQTSKPIEEPKENKIETKKESINIFIITTIIFAILAILEFLYILKNKTNKKNLEV